MGWWYPSIALQLAWQEPGSELCFALWLYLLLGPTVPVKLPGHPCASKAGKGPQQVGSLNDSPEPKAAAGNARVYFQFAGGTDAGGSDTQTHKLTQRQTLQHTCAPTCIHVHAPTFVGASTHPVLVTQTAGHSHAHTPFPITLEEGQLCGQLHSDALAAQLAD